MRGIVHDLRRSNSDKDVLALAELVACGIEQGNVVIAVAAFGTPTPVDVNQAAGVVTIANEGVASRVLVDTGIVNGTARVELGVEDLHPLGRRIILAGEQVDAGVVVEIGNHAVAGLMRIGATARRVIVHAHGHSAVEHQRGDSLGLLFGIAVGLVIGQHIVPIVGGSAKVDRDNAAGSLGRDAQRGLACAMHRILKAIHNL